MVDIVVLLLLLATLANGKSSLQLGEVLNPNDFLLSPGSTFEFGFFPKSDHAPGMFIVGIRFYYIHTVVWTVGGTFTEEASVRLDSQGLFVSDGQKPQVAIVQGLKDVTGVQMEENGNLVITASNGQNLWESFKFPTDTLLPGQFVQGIQVSGDKVILTAGNFTLYLNRNSIGMHCASVSESNSLSYWDFQRPETRSSNISNLLLNSTGIVTFADAGGAWYNSPDDNSYIFVLDMGDANVTRRLTLEKNGNLKIYSLARDNSSWNIVWQALTNECMIFGTCGPFGICSYAPGLVCTCPPGFHFIDPSDHSMGCEHNILPIDTCTWSGNTWVRLDRADYYYNDYNYSGQPRSLQQCKELCENDCNCFGILYKLDGSGVCNLKGPTEGKGPRKVIYNGFQNALSNSVAFLKVSAYDSSLPSSEGNYLPQEFFTTDLDAINNVETLVVKRLVVPNKHKFAVAFAAGGLLAFAAGAFFYRRHVEGQMELLQKEMDAAVGATRFTYHQLEVATNFFKDKLGDGGVSTVFKGVLANGTEVAVKNIEMATQAERQFHAEVATLGKIHHINLVRLLGYCIEESHRLLVYEFMPRGSLETSLFSNQEDEVLHDWRTRFSIATGIARGIAYLHEQCQECIIHCDIKPQNILLDKNFCPKVSDFGVAKLIKREGTMNVTTIRGTRGYMAPEWVRNVTITPKVDVYSFGMVLLEVLSGRDKFPFNDGSSELRHFPVWAFQQYVAGNLDSIADARIVETANWSQFGLVLRVAFWCVQPDASLRPSMSKVVDMLEENVPVREPPFPRMTTSEDDVPKGDSNGQPLLGR